MWCLIERKFILDSSLPVKIRTSSTDRQGLPEALGKEGWPTMPAPTGTPPTKEVSLRQRQIIDDFDEVAKELAASTISRRRALKLTAAAIIGSSGLLALFPSMARAQGNVGEMALNVTVVGQGGCKEGEPAISNRSCRTNQCGSKSMCLCAKTVSGRKRCVN